MSRSRALVSGCALWDSGSVAGLSAAPPCGWRSPPQRYAVVATPDYVARHGKPRHPKDLLDHRCIRIRFGRGALLDWEFEKAGQVVNISPPPRLIANYPGLVQRAAYDGFGFWLTFEGYVREAIKSGALVS